MENNTAHPVTHYHFCQDIEGALKNWTEEDWQSIAEENDTVPGYIKWEFKNMLRDGLRVLPIGNCEGFNYKTGCPGHRRK